MEKKKSQKKLVFKTIFIRSLSILTENLFSIYLNLLITTNTSVAASLVLIDIMVPLRVCISLNPQSAGEGGAIGLSRIKKAISLEPNVGWTSNQAVNLGLSVV